MTIITRAREVEAILRRTIEDQGVGADEACSALANELLSRLVECKQHPQIARQVTEEMRRLAAVINRLAPMSHAEAKKALHETAQPMLVN